MAQRRERGRIALRLMLAVVVLGGAYLAVAWWAGRAIPSSVNVEGVSIGGLSHDQAADRLAKELGPRANASVSVTTPNGGPTLTIDPATAGLSLDIDGTLDGLVSYSLDPRNIWAKLAGHVDRPVKTIVNRDTLTAVLTEKAAAVRVAPTEGSVSVADGTVKTTPATEGSEVAVNEAVDAIATNWPRRPSVPTSVRSIAPAVPQSAIDDAVRTFATPAMSAPVSIVVGDRTAALAPAAYGATITFPAEGGKLVPTIDDEAVRTAVLQATASFTTAPKDARITLDGGSPTVVPSVDGVAVDVAQAPQLFRAAVTTTTPAQRTITLPTTVAKPSLTTEAAQALGVKEVVASFDSVFPNDGPRTQNIIIASRTINGTLLKPGDTFSMNGILGQRTVAKGYGEANVIVNGRLTKGVGGGISQVSTVLYNLSWFAGADLVEHTTHTFYISRYPAGREATVSWPDVDNKFRNSTPYGMLVQLYVSGNTVHGRIWSTKHLDVQAVAGPRVNQTQPRTITDGRPRCVAQSPVPGFDITVTRVISRGGQVVKREPVFTRYLPEDRVVCTG